MGLLLHIKIAFLGD